MIEAEATETEGGTRSVRLHNWGRWAVAALITVASTYLVIRLKRLLILFYLATLLGMAINTFIFKLEKRGISRHIAVVALALIFVGGVVGFGFWVAPPAVVQAQNFANSVPDYIQQGQDWAEGYLENHPGLQSRVGSTDGLLKRASSQTNNILARLGDWAIGLAEGLFSGFVLFVLVFFGLMNPRPMASALFDLSPVRYHDRLERTLDGIQEKVVAWAGGTFIIMAIVGSLIVTGLTLLHVPRALFFGIVAALGEGVPTLGPVIASIPPILVTLLADPPRALAVAALFLVVQQMESNLLVPIVMGNRLKVHPWGLLFMILAMGDLFGFIGLFLATPTAAILEVIYKELIPKPGLDDTVPSSVRVQRVVGGVKGEA